jgi:hypothetical protein
LPALGNGVSAETSAEDRPSNAARITAPCTRAASRSNGSTTAPGAS